MWFAIALFAVAFIAVALLTPKPKIENARASSLSDFNFPRSKEGDPVPIIGGTVKFLSPNTIWTGNFKTEAITKKVKTGLFSSKRQTIGYKYFIGMNLCLCIGPDIVLRKIWFGKKIAWEGSISTEDTITLNLPEFFGGQDKNGGIAGTIAFYPGSMDQSQDPYLVEQIGEGAPNYSGFAHLVFRDFYFGNSANIEPIYLELQYLPNKLGLLPGHHVIESLDANPIELLYDLFSTFWGKLGMDVNLIDMASFRAAGETVWSEKNAMSLEVANANTGTDLTKEILRQVNGIMYQDPESALIKLKLIRRDYDVATLPILTPSSVAEIKNYTKNLWEETFNQVRVKFRNRENNYAEAYAMWQDFANINMQQRVRSSEVSMPGIYTPDTANMIAAREGAELNVPLFQCEFEANREISNLRPGDCFILHWPEFDIIRSVMRIRKFDKGELANGKINVFCVQDEFASDVAVYGSPPGSQWSPPDLTPDPITVYNFLEVPAYFRLKAELELPDTQALLWALPERPDPQSQAFNLQTSLDGFTTAAMSAEEAFYSGAARLVDALPAEDEDGYDTAGVLVGLFDGSFVPITGTDTAIREAGENLFLVGEEIIGYRTVTDDVGSAKVLSNLRRGLLDTAISAHAAGTPIFFLSSIDGIGETTYEMTDEPEARLQDRAPQGTYPLDDAATIGPFEFENRFMLPAPPTYVTYDGQRSGTVAASATAPIAWRERNRLDPVIRFHDDATQTPEETQDNEVRWRINAGSWTTVYVTGDSTTIDTSAAVPDDTVTVEVRSRRDGLFSRARTRCVVTIA